MIRKLILTSLVTAVFALGCSQLPGDVSDGVDDVAESPGDTVQEAADDPGDTIDEQVLPEEDERVLSAIEEMEQECPVEESARPFGEEQDLDAKRTEVRSCESQYERWIGDLEEVGPETRAHPRYDDAQEYMAALDEQLVVWQDEIAELFAERSADRERWNEYRDFFDREHRFLIEALHEMVAADDPTVDVTELRMEERVDQAVDIADREEQCRERFDVEQDYTIHDPDEAMHPSNACDIVYNRGEYMKQYMGLNLDSEARNLQQELEEAIAETRETGLITEVLRMQMTNPDQTRAGLLERYDEYFERLEIEPDDSMLEGVREFDGIQSEFEDAVAAASQETRLDPSELNQNSEVESALNRVVGDMDGYELREYGVAGSDWQIHHTPQGTPEYRQHDGRVALQIDDEDYCRVYDFHATAEYDGSSYGTTRIDLNSGSNSYAMNDETYYRISACP